MPSTSVYFGSLLAIEYEDESGTHSKTYPSAYAKSSRSRPPMAVLYNASRSTLFFVPFYGQRTTHHGQHAYSLDVSSAAFSKIGIVKSLKIETDKLSKNKQTITHSFKSRVSFYAQSTRVKQGYAIKSKNTIITPTGIRG
jgi:hypothetical protein